MWVGVRNPDVGATRVFEAGGRMKGGTPRIRGSRQVYCGEGAGIHRIGNWAGSLRAACLKNKLKIK